MHILDLGPYRSPRYARSGKAPNSCNDGKTSGYLGFADMNSDPISEGIYLIREIRFAFINEMTVCT